MRSPVHETGFSHGELPSLVFADSKGNILDHPYLKMAGMSGQSHVVPSPDELVPLPFGSTLFFMPGRIPIGWDCRQERFIPLSDTSSGADAYNCSAVAAFLPPGYVRTLLPARRCRKNAPTLPLWAYAAVGWKDKSGGIYICEAPGFAEFELLCEIRGQRPFDLCWSPDGNWILLHVAKREEIGPMRLVALEVSTCTLVDIPMPFLVDGERDPRYYVNPGGIDWTK